MFFRGLVHAGRVHDCSPVPSGRFGLRLTASSDAWVVLAVIFHPGWHVTVNGQGAMLHRANAAVSAVPVGPDSHETEVRFVCPALTLGAGVSLAALLTLAGLALAAARRPGAARRKPRPSPRVGPGGSQRAWHPPTQQPAQEP